VVKLVDVGKADAVAEFTHAVPSIDSHWRALVLFGRNVASYKLGLAHALLELGEAQPDLVTLEELAVPFSSHLRRHLATADKQTTSRGSAFLDACRSRNAGTLSDEELIESTVRLGFNNVIDAFHVLDGVTTAERFFVDERRINNAIRITDRLYELVARPDRLALADETESRWSLVEAAWS
jgi:hypothetical protein